MLTITLAATENDPEFELHLEHSLLSLSKWESIHEKPFYVTGEQTHSNEEMLSYIGQMSLDEDPPRDFLERLDVDDYVKINGYINSKQSATWITEQQGPKSREVVTSELIYYWLILYQIPFSCETWHLNRLMMLIKICGIKQSKPKKMSREAMARQYHEMNEKRKAALNSKG